MKTKNLDIYGSEPTPWGRAREALQTAIGVATAEPHGASRWQFES